MSSITITAWSRLDDYATSHERSARVLCVHTWLVKRPQINIVHKSSCRSGQLISAVSNGQSAVYYREYLGKKHGFCGSLGDSCSDRCPASTLYNSVIVGLFTRPSLVAPIHPALLMDTLFTWGFSYCLVLRVCFLVN